jgi:hypothetical protein
MEDEQLNPNGLDLNQSINWEEIDEEYDLDVLDLNYIYVFEESDDGNLKIYSCDYHFIPLFNKLKHIRNFRGTQQPGKWRRHRP